MKGLSSFVFSSLNFLDELVGLPKSVSDTLDFRHSWKNFIKEPESQVKLWIHGASVGELEDLAAFFLSPESMSEAGLSASEIMITASSPSTKSRLLKWQKVHNFAYCGPLPPENSDDVESFLYKYKPENILVSHNDFWPNMFFTWKESRFAKSFFWYKKQKAKDSFIQKTFFEKVDATVLDRRPTGQNAIGNMRIERIMSRILAARELEQHVLALWNADPVPNKTNVIIGSCRIEDAQVFQNLDPVVVSKYNFVILPHHTDNFEEIAQIKHLISVHDEKKIKLINEQGLLLEAYSKFDLAWVGGGFSKSGVHNISEPIAWNIPVICGPNIKPQNEAPEYLEDGSLKTFENVEAMQQFLSSSENLVPLSQACEKSFARVQKNLGALKNLTGFLKKNL